MTRIKKAIIKQRHRINEARDWMLVLLGYQCCLEGTIKFMRGHEWFGSRIEDNQLTIYYWRSGDEVVTHDMDFVREQLRKATV